MHIAILGTGHMATTLTHAILAAGHTVTFGSRDPNAHSGLEAPVAPVSDAIRDADLVISALQAAYSLETLSAFADELSGKVLLDIGNAVTPSFDLMYPNESLAEKLQEALPDAHVVKSLNTLPGTLAVAPATLPEASTVFLSGDDAEAKALVSGLLADLGWPTSTQVDLGGIRSARGAEHYFVLFIALAQALPDQAFNVKIVH